MTAPAIEVSGVTFHYDLHKDDVLHNVSFTVGPGSLTGLLGRNGSGKSTVGMLLAGLLHPQAGTVLVGGEPVFDAPEAMASICYTSDSTAVYRDRRISETFKLWGVTRPTWDADYAAQLLDAFQVNPRKRPDRLSRGQRSALFATLGLASRCPVTVFDEVHLGMDAVVREMFYRALLADYTSHPRTVVVSSHLIHEVEDLLDHVVFLDGGRMIERGEVDDVRARHSRPGQQASLTDILMDLTLTTAQREVITPKGDDDAH